MVAAGLAALSVLFFAAAIRPSPTPTVPVVVAAHDIDGGVALESSDLAIVDVPADLASPGSQVDPASLLGEVVIGPIAAGEQVSTTRLLGGRPQAGKGRVAAPVRLADAGLAGLLRPGDRIDLLATGSDTAAITVARSARVITQPVDSDIGSHAGVVLIVSLSPEEALSLASTRGRALTAVLVAER